MLVGRRGFVAATDVLAIAGPIRSAGGGALPAVASPRTRERLAAWRFHLGHASDQDLDFGFGRDQRTFAKARAVTADAALPRFDPPTTALLDLADATGMLMIVEARRNSSDARWRIAARSTVARASRSIPSRCSPGRVATSSGCASGTKWTRYGDLADVTKTIRRAKAAGMQVRLDFLFGRLSGRREADGARRPPLLPICWGADTLVPGSPATPRG